VLGIFLRTVFAYQRRRVRAQGLAHPEVASVTAAAQAVAVGGPPG
jgi:hypothetical protein